VAELMRVQCPAEGPGDLRMVATSANGQPACAGYLRGADGVHRPFQLLVLSTGRRPDGTMAITHVHCSFDVALFPRFGLPETVPGA